MKIIDSIIFLKELDLLEIRLNILDSVVDYFVITESPFTFSGNEKPLYYQQNKDRFSKFNHKIIHNIIEEIPKTQEEFSYYDEKRKYFPPFATTRDLTGGQLYKDIPVIWKRGIFSRNMSAYGIEKAGAEDNDLIITSDADEIVNPQLLENLDWFDPNNHYVAHGPAYYFKLNYLYTKDWMGSRLCTWKMLKDKSVGLIRSRHNESHIIENSSWHFSFLGDVEFLKLKLKSYEHCDELNTKDILQRAESGFLEKGLDVFGRGETYKAVPIDDSYPEYIQNNQEKYKELIASWN
tara:strand:- start:501 stop:1379 length:879 start_codon:yes stop_codon:yes gene_type:complete